MYDLVDEFVQHDMDSYSDNSWDGWQILTDNGYYFNNKWHTAPLYCTNVRREILQFVDIDKPGLKLLDVWCSCGGNILGKH